MVFTRTQARTFYDRFGKKQDAQAFYEDAALNELIIHGKFEEAESVFEFGCGTGRFAARLLTRHLPPSAWYLGIDLSQTMIDITKQRILPFAERARAILSEGAMRLPLADHSVDRVVSTYVFDLLSTADAAQAVSEAFRVLMPYGKLCLVSLTFGVTFASRLVSTVWQKLFQLHAPLVGGCRPVRLVSLFDQQRWSLEYSKVISQFAVPSEVIIACSIKRPGSALHATGEGGH